MTAARRARRRKPFTPITDLATYPHQYVVLPALKEYWQVEHQTLVKWIKEGSLPAYKFGRSWRVKTADALAFEERNRVEHGS